MRLKIILVVSVVAFLLVDSAIASSGAWLAPVFPGIASKFLNLINGNQEFNPSGLNFLSTHFNVTQNSTEFLQDRVSIRTVSNHSLIQPNASTNQEVLNSAPFADFTSPNLSLRFRSTGNPVNVHYWGLFNAPLNPTGSYLATALFVNHTQHFPATTAMVFTNNTTTVFGSTNAEYVSVFAHLHLPAGLHQITVKYTTLGTGVVFATDGARGIYVEEVPGH